MLSLYMWMVRRLLSILRKWKYIFLFIGIVIFFIELFEYLFIVESIIKLVLIDSFFFNIYFIKMCMNINGIICSLVEIIKREYM